jgi:hypothetical protein
MESMMTRKQGTQFLCLLVAILVAASSAGQQGSTTPVVAEEKQQVLDLEQEWVNAELRHDATTLRRILDDKFVASFGAGKPYNKAGFIKAVSDGAVDPTESQILTDRTVIIDGDTAVIVGTDTARETDKGVLETVVYRYTVTYIRRGGHWVALAEHLVETPKPR